MLFLHKYLNYIIIYNIIENNTLKPSEDATYIKENLLLAIGDHSSRSPHSRDLSRPPYQDEIIKQNV